MLVMLSLTETDFFDVYYTRVNLETIKIHFINPEHYQKIKK